MANILTSERLANGTQIEFCDSTNRYYGDYHRVSIDVILSFAGDNYATEYKFQQLTRMGVQGSELEKVKAELIAAFQQGTMPYMGKEQFPEKFIKTHKQRKNVLLPGLK